MQSSAVLPQRPYLLQQEYPVREGKFSHEYLLPQEPSGEVTRPPGRVVGDGVAEVVDEVVDVLEDEDEVVLESTVVDEEEESVVVETLGIENGILLEQFAFHLCIAVNARMVGKPFFLNLPCFDDPLTDGRTAFPGLLFCHLFERDRNYFDLYVDSVQ